MALKPYSELVKIDVLKDCDMRDAYRGGNTWYWDLSSPYES